VVDEGAGEAIWLVNLGVEPYQPILDLQHRLMAAKRDGWRRDVLLLLEHEPVYTLGLLGKEANILADEAFLRRHGIEVTRVDRGGDVTYHGPGQLVGYPILDLHHFRQDVGWYVRALAEVIIRTLADYGLEGRYEREYPGVWLDSGKICAFGSRNKRWIMYHGFALNLAPNMEHWAGIVPCGLKDTSVATLEASLGWLPAAGEVRGRLIKHFGDVFERPVIEVRRELLEETVGSMMAAGERA
jgi:lipoate-protein ligase B